MGKKSKKKKLKHPEMPLRLAQFRLGYGWSQADLAERLDTSDVSIGRIEAGKQNWNQEFLQEAARILDVHWLELLPLPASETLEGLWAQIPEDDRERALGALKLFVRKEEVKQETKKGR